ncbi:MAG: ABC transporter substrate-binding protein [Candidatus Moranbacteria bacterium]|nr:ABC transporter substrate-binding protein [Candidatus Moranbacteria bacterium]
MSWGVIFYLNKTQPIPKFGGEYIEGIIGQPLHINSVISQSNNTDEDLSQIIYNGLFKYDDQGKIANDLAEGYEISKDKMLYTVHLKKNVTWHDGQPFTAADVFYTINLISDPAYKSPLRVNWQGIETSVVDDYTLTFQLKISYARFLSNLTFGILPKHIWETVGPEKFSLTDLNLQPIGTGAYKFSSIQKDSGANIISLKLVSNPNYFEGKPYISKITFNFYLDEESVLAAFNRKEIMGINSLSPQKISSIKNVQSTVFHKLKIPRYFAVFINKTRNVALASDEVREALALATNRDEIIQKVLDGNGRPIFSPILPGMIGFTDNLEKYNLDVDRANRILDENGWVRGADGFRGKKGNLLEFAIVTPDVAELTQTADLLKAQWEKIGAKINVSAFSLFDVQQNYIKTREYDALLFGQILGSDPDPFSFWHSSQKKDPGLNLSVFSDGEIDTLIEDGRNEFDEGKRAKIYEEFQQKLVKEIPAIFLYSPDYIYPVNRSIKGINIENLIFPAERFANLSKWYIKTKRVWK